MTYKVTAYTPEGNLTVEVEGKSKFLCIDLARHYFRAAFGEDVELSWKKVDDDQDDRLPRTYAEPEYTSKQLENDPIAIESAKWDDRNYQYYMER